MAILKIARMGHPVLKRRAAEVDDPTAPEIARLIGDMVETMEDADGAGLAAPQVHVSQRVVIFQIARERLSGEEGEEGQEAVPLTRLINPVIEPLGEDKAVGLEACLSLPGLAGLVPRFKRIHYRGLAPDGTAIEREAEGFHARVVQHECDHLDGILYPERMADLSTLAFTSEMARPEAL
jgi:peptide deformylase